MNQIRKGDGGVFLVIADETPEFNLALRYAARLAENRRGHVGILQMLDDSDFQEWGNVEAMVRRELRQKAEQQIWSAARTVHELTGRVCSFYIGEGEIKDFVLETLGSDAGIAKLILAVGAGAKSPGPVLSYLMSKGLGELRVPVVIVPGSLNIDRIDEIS